MNFLRIGSLIIHSLFLIDKYSKDIVNKMLIKRRQIAKLEKKDLKDISKKKKSFSTNPFISG